MTKLFSIKDSKGDTHRLTGSAVCVFEDVLSVLNDNGDVIASFNNWISYVVVSST